MNAVWSFWSKPFTAHHRSAWPSEFHHLLAWVLSVETAKRHYPATLLYTDAAGAQRLVDGLGLRFTQVSTALNALESQDADWWTLGKIYTYSLQSEPFVHIDSDVFLWKPLPPRLEQAAVFAQNPVPFTVGKSFYQPEQVEAVLKRGNTGWLPAEWLWYRRHSPSQRGECCGIVGGRQVDFICHYAGQALRLVEEPANQPNLRRLTQKQLHTILFEEYLLAACVEYHRRAVDSPYRGVMIEYLFDSMAAIWNPDALARAGYTHLMTGAKRNALLAQRLERRVQHDYPDYYKRCLHLANLSA